MKRSLPYLIFLLLSISSCDLINPEEALPAYLQVNEFFLTSEEATEGSNSHQITDVWAFVGGEALGVFELPATIPILETGEQPITLFAGIRENGLKSAPAIYPMYEKYEATINLIPEMLTTINPTIGYERDNAVFVWLEDFEDSTISLTGASTSIQQTLDPTKVREGRGAGTIPISTEAVEITTKSTFLDLPTSGGLPVYLELEYRTNIELEVGLVGLDINVVNPIAATSYKVVLCPIDNWNKVYINFQADLEQSQFEGYKIAFRVSTEDTGCGNIDTSNPEVLLDNIKLVRFQP